MRIPSLCEYRPGVNRGCTPIIALFVILLWISLGANTRAVEFDFDITILSGSGEPYRSEQQHRRYGQRNANGIPDPAACDGDEVQQDIPTIIPTTCGSAETRAKELSSAIEGTTANRQTVIDIFSKCTRAQRQMIRDAYSKMYRKNLINTMNNNYKEAELILLTKSLTLSLGELLANRLCYVIESEGVDEFLVPFDNDISRVMIKERYSSDCRNSINSKIREIDPTISNIRKSQFNGHRSSDNIVNWTTACEDAKKIEKDLKTDNWWNNTISILHPILMTTNFRQLRKVNECFKNLTGKSVQKLISESRRWEGGDSYQIMVNAYVHTLNYADDKALFFAEKLKDSLSASYGTDYMALIFIISWRADIDLGNIKEAYKRLCKTSLYDNVARYTSGEYRDLLLAIIGK